MTTSRDCLDDALVAALAAGDEAARPALAHLEHCEACRELVSAACAAHTDAEPAHGLRLARGRRLGRYQIEQPLGAGGMGVVYLARDLELDRHVAIKLLRGEDEAAHDRLVRESQALARLKHPNVVTAHEVGRHDGASFLVMEHVEGGNVRDWLAERPRSTEEIVDVYLQAARGLAAAHAAGIVHRDVKPDNVLVGAERRVRLSDFGLAGHDAPHVTGGAAFAGTPRYAAPEVLAGAPADPRSDLWSLCASLWEALAAAPPFAGTTREEVAAAIARGLPAWPAGRHVPRWLRRAVTRGLRVDPTERFDGADRLVSALSPERGALRRSIPAVAVVAIVAAGVGAHLGASDPRPACGGEVDIAWGPAQRLALAAHFARFGEAGAALVPALENALDRYAAAWNVQRADVCRADENDRMALLRASCLDRARRSVSAAVDTLAMLPAGALGRARAALTDLPPLGDCAPGERLAQREPLPRDPLRRTALAQLDQRYAAARSLTSVGQHPQALTELRAVAAAARALGYYPLVADALGAVGRAETADYRPQAVATLRDALAAAIAGGDDLQLAHADVDLLVATTLLERPTAERDEIRARAGALLERLRWREDPEARACESQLALFLGRDDLLRGRLDRAESELRHSIALGIQEWGARSSMLALPRTSLARLLANRGDADEAATLLAQSLDLDDADFAGLGTDLTSPGEGEESHAIIDAAWQLHDVGRDDQALAFVRRARAAAGPVPSPFYGLTLDDLESEIAVGRRDFARARTLNDRAIGALGAQATPSHLAGLRLTRAEILEGTGDRAGAEREYRAVIATIGDDLESRQIATVGLARCRAAAGDDAGARALLEPEVARGILEPRLAPGTLLLAAELRWRTGERASALAAARAALAHADKLPALAAEHAAIERWLAAHSQK